MKKNKTNNQISTEIPSTKLIGKLLILYDLIVKKLTVILKALSGYLFAYLVLLINAYFVYEKVPLEYVICFACFSAIFYIIVRVTSGDKKV